MAAPTMPTSYGAYQSTLYGAGILHSRLPIVTTDPNKLEEQAKSKLPLTAYNYVAGGAGERATMDANRLAFRTWKLVPRMLTGVGVGERREMGVELWGVKYETPLLMAPIGVQSIFHPSKETGLASVCASLKIPYILSTASTSSIEEVAAASGPGSPRWFQLYWPRTNALTQSLLSRAKAAGYTVLVVTLDTFALAWRPADLDEAYIPFVTGTGNAVGFSDPEFRRMFEAKYPGKSIEENLGLASQEWISEAFPGAAHSWEDLKLLREGWEGKIVLKGIQDPEDARWAVECGMDGIICSNHGGRQLDGAIGSLTMLPELVDAVEGKIPVLFDSGIRTGVDIIKALSLGAAAVLVGRPVIYGLSIAGKAGAEQVLRGLLADLDQSLGLAGLKGVEECTREVLREVRYPGDVKASN